MREKLAIIASESCRAQPPASAKRWWHIRRFVQAYAEVLEQFEIVATAGTAEILDEVQLRTSDSGSRPRLAVSPIGPSFEGVVRLAASVARREVRSVLWFQDPNDLDLDRPENLALFRNCNLAGALLYMNAAAHLWALSRGPLTRRTPVDQYLTTPQDHGKNRAQETVILIAHDAEKMRMSRFALHYRSVLRRFPRIFATSGTKKHIDAFLKDHAAPHDRLNIEAVGATAAMAHGPSGGDVIVADEIFQWYGTGGVASHGQHVFHHVLFFADNHQSHAHEADIRVLLKTCANLQHRVNLILNSKMAEEWGNRYLATPAFVSAGVSLPPPRPSVLAP
jgi:methylglyoxal synthase